MNSLIFLYFLGLVAAGDITVTTFPGTGCNGTQFVQVQSVPGRLDSGSGCVSSAAFQSVKLIQGTVGFQCNVFADDACQTFVGTVAPTADLQSDICTTIAGQGVICFDQGNFGNPFADSTAEVTVGSLKVTVDIDGRSLINSAISQGCSDNGCDPTNKFTRPFDHFNKHCTQSVSVEGNFDNTDQRDYMKGLLAEALFDTGTNARQDLTGSSAGNQDVADVGTFVQVVINDALGNNQAQISATVANECQDTSALDCQSTTDVLTEGTLSAIPAVGGLAVAIFKVICKLS